VAAERWLARVAELKLAPLTSSDGSHVEDGASCLDGDTGNAVAGDGNGAEDTGEAEDGRWDWRKQLVGSPVERCR
jgi:hypothetical protein